MKYARIVAEFHSQVWAIREETLLAMAQLLRRHAYEGERLSAEEIRVRIDQSNLLNGYEPHKRLAASYLAFDDEPLEMQAAGKRVQAPKGSVALIPLVGIISHRMNMMADISGPGGASTQQITGLFRQALEDSNCQAIVFDCDSPGGSVEGVSELATEIYNGRKRKPITACVNAMAASAAYWIASAAKEVVITPSGQAGSIGVYMIHQDESKALEQDGIKVTAIKAGKYKIEGAPWEPLTDEARAAFQTKVDALYSMFLKAVAQNRGDSQANVREGYGEGRCLLAGDAVKQGLVDRIGTLDDVLGKYGVKTSGGAAACSPEPPQAKSDPDDEEEAADRPNACKACQGCTAATPCACRPNASMSCSCACDACKLCDNKPPTNSQATDIHTALERRRRMLSLLKLSTLR
jgi:signal peptide peptidase SppA